jgi:hypothetical protein
MRESLSSAAATLVAWLFNPGCPLCRGRTDDLEQHLRSDHAEPAGRWAVGDVIPGGTPLDGPR